MMETQSQVFKEGEKLFRKFFWEVGEIEGYWKQVEIQI